MSCFFSFVITAVVGNGVGVAVVCDVDGVAVDRVCVGGVGVCVGYVVCCGVGYVVVIVIVVVIMVAVAINVYGYDVVVVVWVW